MAQFFVSKTLKITQIKHKMGAKPPWGETLRLVRAEGPILGTIGPIYIQFDHLDCNFKGLKQGEGP